MKVDTKILIVEDEKITAEDLARILNYLGYSVCGRASTAEEAINEVKKNVPDLILMDIKLKGETDGVMAAEQIQERFDIPIIYMTAMTDDVTLQRVKVTMPFGFICKPIDEKDLKASIEMALYRHKLDRKLKESEEQYRDLVEKSGIAILIDDKEGHLKYSNDKLAELFGYSIEEMKKQSIRTIVQPEDVERVIGYHKKRVRGGKAPSRYEFKGIRKDGSEIYLEVDAVVLKKEENIIGTRSYIWDITERKRAEEEKKSLQAQLVHSEKMAGIGTLAGGIAHEFNNLLQIMRGHVEYAQKTKRKEDIEEAYDLFIHHADRAARIIKDLLTFSIYEPSEKQRGDITEAIEAVLLLVEEQFKKQNIEIIRNYKKVSQVEMNKAEMQQVFLNMITNARDAMLFKGGKLVIGVYQDKKNVKVSFTDSGRGIEKKNLSHVFDPFYTTKQTANSNSLSGTGLSLSVSYGAVKRHGGTIEVESELDKGTTFTVKLPVNGAEAKRRVVKKKEKGKTNKTQEINILVADDEEIICRMLNKWLSTEGFQVKSVLTGKKAVDMVEKEYFDVLLLDLVMPGMPAIEVLEKIKEISPETKVVIITGQLPHSKLLKGLKQKGASSFIQKPFKIDDILQIIKSLTTG